MGALTVEDKPVSARIPCSQWAKKWCDKLGDWTPFLFIEVLFGFPLSLLWIFVWDFTLHPLYRDYQNGEHKKLSRKTKDKVKILGGHAKTGAHAVGGWFDGVGKSIAGCPKACYN